MNDLFLVGDKVIAWTTHGVVLKGYVRGTRDLEETTLVIMDLDGTSSTVEVDIRDFTWNVIY